MKGKPISRISRRGLILSPTLFRFLKGVSRLFRWGLFWPHRFSWDEKWQLGENLSWAKGGGPKTPHRWRIVQSFNSERINPMCRTKLLPRYLEKRPFRCCSKTQIQVLSNLRLWVSSLKESTNINNSSMHPCIHSRMWNPKSRNLCQLQRCMCPSGPHCAVLVAHVEQGKGTTSSPTQSWHRPLWLCADDKRREEVLVLAQATTWILNCYLLLKQQRGEN